MLIQGLVQLQLRLNFIVKRNVYQRKEKTLQWLLHLTLLSRKLLLNAQLQRSQKINLITLLLEDAEYLRNLNHVYNTANFYLQTCIAEGF
jgi:hypothetical protein